ncbi:hypothetical protein HHK36_002047 [Tetracentron sinense]|uniref:FAS1 domain-containing protein n=1 Tax=Tetracentron sinense TaxID=13715 RepID=A0A834Y8N7_TETSI|nr:hypothetical protein HHK36_031724 [Tetracentron sinense]KAF8414048.1 hypothetical protein HHK36_002047 [Tetracentron sinense]
MASSCSHWWHAPIYFTVAVTLAIVAISTSIHTNPNTQMPLSPKPDSPIAHELSLNASRALRRSGFTFMATLLQISPELFLQSSESTIFAITDSVVSNISLPTWLMKALLHYHTSPSKLSMEDLLKKAQGSCLPTLLHGKNLAITKTNDTERSVEINQVSISHPDIFVQGPFSIHGVVGSFSSLDLDNIYPGRDFIQSPICDSRFSLIQNVSEARYMVEWTRILRLLSSNGFISFSIGLHSVLDGILQDNADLSSVTIFAPPDFAYVASPSPLLERIVRFHILPERFTYIELASLPEKASLRTLVPYQDLEITGGVNSTTVMAINGVKITQPNVFSSKKFMIHGISRGFEMLKLSTTSS